jgi:SAM-dependent methyltransferase
MPVPQERSSLVHMPHSHATGHQHHDDDAVLAALLDLDAEVLRTCWTGVLAWVRQNATGCRRILDLGAGTGAGSIPLAERFVDAEVVAVDSSEAMLRRLRVKALDLGLAPRIRTIEADLDGPWPGVGPVDVTWASMSLHHLADPDRVLRDVFAATRPGGLMAVVEMAEPVRFLPDDVGSGRPGLESRCLEALAEVHAQDLPNLGSEWPGRLESAGFVIVGERTMTIELDPPHAPAASRYARLWLERMRSALTDRLAHDDVATLAALLDGDGPLSIRRRTDLRIRGTRSATLARRPSELRTGL